MKLFSSLSRVPIRAWFILLPGAVILALLAAAHTATCQQDQKQDQPQKETQEPKASPDGLGAVADGLQLRLQTAKSWVEPCEPILVIMTSKNVSTEDRFIYMPGRLSTYRFEVRDENGREMPLTREGWSAYRTGGSCFGQKLSPGEERTDIIILNKVHEMTYEVTYTVIAKRDCGAPGKELPKSGPVKVSMRGAPQPPEGFHSNLEAIEALTAALEKELALPADKKDAKRVEGIWKMLQEQTGEKFEDDVEAWKLVLAAEKAQDALKKKRFKFFGLPESY